MTILTRLFLKGLIILSIALSIIGGVFWLIIFHPLIALGFMMGLACVGVGADWEEL